MKILVTGGAGYIGSHASLRLLEAGHDVTIIDNFCNSSRISIDRVQELAGREIRIIQGDVGNYSDLARCFDDEIEAVVHFAALKSVGDSCANPLLYFENNIGGTITLMRAMQAYGVNRLIFSSSATVYGQQLNAPVREDAPLQTLNPYGQTKLVMEQLIQTWCMANPQVSAVLLRYFNPVGAHFSGRIGEDPRGEPGNLMPYVAQVAVGRRGRLRVFGRDYPTEDGTGIRDYIHVMDLADAHLKAVDFARDRRGCEVFNLGTGRGYSVLELVRTFEAVTGRSVPLEFVGRREGDVGQLLADPGKANRELGWWAQRGIEQMCEDAWRWQVAHPNGYEDQVLTCNSQTAE